MSRPPNTTIIFDGVPTDWIVGIDLQFFNTNTIFKGIKLIPDGIHIVHVSQDLSSIRHGYCFKAVEEEVIVLHWDKENEKLLINDEVGELNVLGFLSKLPEYYPFMITYPKDDNWNELVRYIKLDQVEYILPHGRKIDSVMTSTDENNLLLDALQKSAKDRNLSNDPIINSIIDQHDEEIKFTSIDLKNSIRPNSTTEEKTKDSLDKSWFLERIIISGYNGDTNLLLGEFQLAYLNTIIFANYSSSVQWLKLIRVLLNCREALLQREAFFKEFLKLLYRQLEIFPQDYVDQFLDVEFWKIGIHEIEYNVKDLNLHGLVKDVIFLKNLLNDKLNIDIDDQLEDEDEDGPVIVEL